LVESIIFADDVRNFLFLHDLLKDQDLYTTLYQTECAGKEMMKAARIAFRES